MLAAAAYYGPVPVEWAIDRCEELLADVGGDRGAQADVLLHFGCLEAMRGRFDTARDYTARARQLYLDVGQRAGLDADWALLVAEIEMLAGRPNVADAILEHACESIEQRGDRAWLATLGGALAEARYTQGQIEDALRLATRAMELSPRDDLAAELAWRRARAKALARLGDASEGDRLAREAIALLDSTDMLSKRGEALVDLAEVLRLAGRAGEAAAAANQAMRLFEAKGNVVLAERTRVALNELNTEAIA